MALVWSTVPGQLDNLCEVYGMAEDNETERSSLRLVGLFLLLIVLPLALGTYAGPRLMPAPKVGVVRLNYDIFSLTAMEVSQQLAYAREEPSIKAVALVINSPGGSAVYSEELYLDVLATRHEMPVVASIDLIAASGGYYMAAAANEIYAKPTSAVGSIGVIAFLPIPGFIEEEMMTTGPHKAFGGTRDGMVRQMEIAKYSFLRAVATGRGERLTIDLDTLSRAEIFTGVQAWEMGLVDGLHSTGESIQRAAELAGLRNYEAVELYPLVFNNGPQGDALGRYQPPPVDAHKLWAQPVDLAPGLYYRYVDYARN
jgi:protease IV